MSRAGIVAALLIALAASASAQEVEPLEVGSPFPELVLEDQHGETHRVDAGVRLVLFSRDMDGGGLIREVLAETGAAFLEKRSAVYVADVHRMPRLIRAAIAKPRMRRRPYPMLLDERGEPTASLPSREGQASVLFLGGGRVERIAFADSVAALRGILGLPAPPAEE